MEENIWDKIKTNSKAAYDKVAQYSTEINASWGFARACSGAIGAITKEHNKVAYVHAGIDIKNQAKKLYYTFKFNQKIKTLEYMGDYGIFYDFWVDLIRDCLDITELGNLDESGRIFFSADINSEIEILWSQDFNRIGIVDLYITKGKTEQFLLAIKNLLSQTRGKFLSLRNADKVWKIQSMTNYSKISNELADFYADKIRKYNSCGLGRSILFYGPPGTGKTNLANTIAIKLDRNCLSFGNLGNFLTNFADTDFGLFTSTLGIDILILDDLDHVNINDQQVILKRIEELRLNGKTLLATANNIGELNPALIRAGRFDEIKEIKTLNPHAVMELVGDDKILFDLVKDFPVSYIVEIMNRIKVLGREEALSEENMKDIGQRVQCLWESEGE